MKTLAKSVLLAALMMFFVSLAYADKDPQNTGQKNAQTTQAAKPGKFVDNNKDGICDNHQAKAACGKCTGFVDKNGDGKCDNCQGTNCKGTSCKNGGGNCCGKGNMNGKGAGCGTGNGNGCQQRHGCGQGPCKNK